MSDEYDYVKADIAMEVDYPASPGVQPPSTPSVAYVSYVIDTPGAKPGEEGLYDGMEVTSVPASSREIVEWQAAYRRFDERVQNAHLTLQAAEVAWRQAMEDWASELRSAVTEYGPVNDEIEARKAMVEAQDDLLEERRRQGRQVVEVAALEAEDAVLGARSWVIFNGASGKTLHHVMCSRYGSTKSPTQWGKPFRVVEARQALLQANVRACKQCKAEDHVNQVEKARMNARIPEQRQG